MHYQFDAQAIGAHAEAALAKRPQADDGADLAIGGDVHRRQASSMRQRTQRGAAAGQAGAGERHGAQDFSSRRIHAIS